MLFIVDVLLNGRCGRRCYILLMLVLVRGVLVGERVLMLVVVVVVVVVAVRCQRFGPTHLCSRTHPTVGGAHGSQHSATFWRRGSVEGHITCWEMKACRFD